MYVLKNSSRHVLLLRTYT
uniref:Uncharacterized protein n=1 Tax=Arundo donax TaxID=35708 RepID=A0A0A9B9Q4_ARUDO